MTVTALKMIPVRSLPRPIRAWRPFSAILPVCLALMLSLPAAPLAQTEGTAGAPQTGAAEPAPAPQTLRGNIVDLLANEPRLPLPVRQMREDLRAYYEAFGGEPLWLGTRRAAQLIARLRDAEADGLRSQDYPSDQLERLAGAAAAAGLRSRAVIELHFSAAFLKYASDLRVGRFLPNKVDPNFFLQGRSIDRVAALRGVGEAAELDEFLAWWQPAAPQYAALRALLGRYRAIAILGGWTSVPLGETLKPGMSDPRVPAIRARLAQSDGAAQEAAPGGEEELYDDALAAAVERFQARHGLTVDGIVGPATIVALNVPVEDRIDSIVVSMERWRWMPEDLGIHHVMVNIAGFELRRVRAGAVREKMAVVVGKPYNRTPVFSNEIQYLEFNPYWNVPISIALNEELPKLRRNPGALAANGFEAVLDGRVYDVRSIDWRRYGSGNFPFRLRQRPGAGNALGRVKFMFPNQHNVYLHDTPARSLFSRAERAFSHGCIRLERPLELAEQVLDAGEVAGWDKGKIDAVVGSRDRTVVNLNEPLPVHITYLTAWVDSDTAQFRKDIYSHDEKLLAALDGRSIAW